MALPAWLNASFRPVRRARPRRRHDAQGERGNCGREDRSRCSNGHLSRDDEWNVGTVIIKMQPTATSPAAAATARRFHRMLAMSALAGVWAMTVPINHRRHRDPYP